ncbi:MAG: CDP-diacylglycerol--glycerol-3-phosphate 3-phosphatidyltransferase [Planctomycetia bacterium]|nr:CDP-diacylglycerol--glycerol-3-phosphate 3-phosphatidyltransferase [Planctomycetia bacterium]
MTEKTTAVHPIWNVPNILTFLRIVLAIIMFALIPFGCYKTAMIFFIIAAGTDYFDGWYARKFHQITQLGRILDPFADKLLVCGSFIYLVAIPDLNQIHLNCSGHFNWGLAPWMVVVIVLRELLITMLRSLIESQGTDFSAKWIGKWKMGLQCIAVPACFLYLIISQNGNVPVGLSFLVILSLWGTVILTLYSGIQYIYVAIKCSKK